MAIQRFAYPARLSTDEAGRVLVAFVDIPWAATDGADEAEARAEAVDCLDEAIAACITDGHDIPMPSKPRKNDRLIPLSPVMAAKAALYQVMRDAGLTKVALARRLGCNEKDVRRMLDPKHPTKIPALSNALAALGKRLVIEVRDAA